MDCIWDKDRDREAREKATGIFQAQGTGAWPGTEASPGFSMSFKSHMERTGAFSQPLPTPSPWSPHS